MWDFLRYTSGERAFSFSRGTSEMTGAGTGAGAEARARIKAQSSRTALRIYCNLSSEYLGTLVTVAGALARSFTPKGQADWLDNLSLDLGGGEKSGGAMEEATEGATEGRSQRGQPRP